MYYPLQVICGSRARLFVGACLVSFSAKESCTHVPKEYLLLLVWTSTPGGYCHLSSTTVCCSPECALPLPDWKKAGQLQPHKSQITTKLACLVLKRRGVGFIRTTVFTLLEPQGFLLFLCLSSFSYIQLVIKN